MIVYTCDFNVLASGSYSKQRSYTKQSFPIWAGCIPSWIYSKADVHRTTNVLGRYTRIRGNVHVQFCGTSILTTEGDTILPASFHTWKYCISYFFFLKYHWQYLSKPGFWFAVVLLLCFYYSIVYWAFQRNLVRNIFNRSSKTFVVVDVLFVFSVFPDPQVEILPIFPSPLLNACLACTQAKWCRHHIYLQTNISM